MPTRLCSVTFDANDHSSLARWWADSIGWRFAEEFEQYDEGVVQPTDGTAFELVFVPVGETKQTKNRIHLDLAAVDEMDRDAVAERVESLGARRIDVGQPADAHWTVMADPEGNEFCIWPGTRPSADGPAIYAVSFDVVDAARLGRFWSAATGWRIVFEGDRDEEHTVFLSTPDAGTMITVSGPVPNLAPKAGKNRVHFDIARFTDDDHQSEVDRLISFGASRIDIGQGDVPWVVMSDPEGNEFCVLMPR